MHDRDTVIRSWGTPTTPPGRCPGTASLFAHTRMRTRDGTARPNLWEHEILRRTTDHLRGSTKRSRPDSCRGNMPETEDEIVPRIQCRAFCMKFAEIPFPHQRLHCPLVGTATMSRLDPRASIEQEYILLCVHCHYCA
jgi:hypothetical protein